MKTASHTLKTDYALTEDQMSHLGELAELPDEATDTSDLPELTTAQLADMDRGKFYKPVKKQITTRLDADVLNWLKAKGKGYQTRMNYILREAMLKDQ